jgi:hypothetical protein
VAARVAVMRRVLGRRDVHFLWCSERIQQRCWLNAVHLLAYCICYIPCF